MLDAWRFRLSGLLLAYANGTVPCTSLPRATWQEIVYGQHEEEAPSSMVPPVAATNPAAKFNMTGIEEEVAALRSVKHSYKSRKAVAVAAKKAAAAQVGALPSSGSDVRDALRVWCIFALRREKRGRVSIGYAPSTVKRYLRALFHVFTGWEGESPLSAPAVNVAKHITCATCR